VTIIEFRRLSMPEAEEIMVALWSCFEEYDVPAPPMTFEFHGLAGVTMWLHIEDAALADVVAIFLSNWNCLQCSGGRARVAVANSRMKTVRVPAGQCRIGNA
jgi:hypothetical protein